ncbi:hypothetical protein TraAM80_09314 [Trypanosoma rangeli]|uniref:Uncharacterized protein n=1 Tax=Trypanosoma rangeli TaxID=5698 RepID=A0A3R7MZ21_TRYRA|nr:uncharacterized protein TraAM80_09314 [Trypanosoma rangeli]RNE97442.1 hypothetical protein TraAM80_09314 [Trypanosoma rangeli]|eukprot:RNE97442.1 hypothetical protein TraAM80_09314 [Trypanosoma rangeli]
MAADRFIPVGGKWACEGSQRYITSSFSLDDWPLRTATRTGGRVTLEEFSACLHRPSDLNTVATTPTYLRLERALSFVMAEAVVVQVLQSRGGNSSCPHCTA